MTGTHGIPSAYNNGCRCDECRLAHRARMARIRADLFSRPRDQVPHGTRGGYINWGCRCQPCTTAATVANRENCKRYAAKKRAERKAAQT